MRKYSLHIKIIIGGMFVFFVPFLIGGFITYVKISGSVETLAREKLSQIAMDASKIINLNLIQELKIASTIAADPQVVEIFSTGNFRKIDNKLIAIGKRLGRTDYDDFILIDKKGIVMSVSSDIKRVGIVLTDREYFKKAMNGEANVSEPVVSRATGELIVVACVPVFSKKGTVSGAAAGIIRIDYLIKSLSSIRAGNSGYLFMVNSEGLVIIHPRRDYILKENLASHPGMTVIREQMLGKRSGTENYIYNGIKKIAGFAPVDITGWSLGVTQNRDEIMAPAKSLLDFIVISSVIFFVAAMTAIYFISRKISTPVEKSLEIFNQVILHTSETVVYIGTDRKIIRINSAVEKLTGYSEHEIIGTVPVFANTNNISADEIWDTLNEGRAWSGRLVVIAKNGEQLTIESIVLPVLDEKGKIYIFIEIGRDITKELVTEQRLKDARRMESIGILAGGIAHDFNNILAGIFGYAEITLMNLSSPERVQGNIREILNASQRARDLVNQILAFSRKTETELRPVKPKNIIKEALSFLRASIPSAIEIQDSISSDSVIMGDPSQLHQVIVNIFTNAAYSMKSASGLISVTMYDMDVDREYTIKHPGLKPGKHVMIKISDTGCGMDSYTMEHIFDPFFTTKPPGEGTGLGLSVVHGIIKNLKGVVTVYSEPGKGTVFNIIIPAIVSGGLETESVEIEKYIGGTERVFLVDDETMIIDSIRTILSNLGYTVTSFSDGRHALEYFRKNPLDFDVVITDYTMPSISGIELTRNIKSVRGDIPVILNSGYVDKKLEEEALEAGVTLFIKKPVMTGELAVLLRKILDNVYKESTDEK